MKIFILLAMLADSDRSNRVIAVERINTIRQASIASPGQQTVRVFQAPKVKEDAVCLKDLHRWKIAEQNHPL